METLGTQKTELCFFICNLVSQLELVKIVILFIAIPHRAVILAQLLLQLVLL